MDRLFVPACRGIKQQIGSVLPHEMFAEQLGSGVNEAARIGQRRVVRPSFKAIGLANLRAQIIALFFTTYVRPSPDASFRRRVPKTENAPGSIHGRGQQDKCFWRLRQ
jgi:hypothetical protein